MKIKYLEFCQFLNKNHSHIIRMIMEAFINDKKENLLAKLVEDEEIFYESFINFDVDYIIHETDINHVSIWFVEDSYTYKQTVLFHDIFSFKHINNKGFIFHEQLYDWFDSKTFENFYNEYYYLKSATDLNLL